MRDMLQFYIDGQWSKAILRPDGWIPKDSMPRLDQGCGGFNNSHSARSGASMAWTLSPSSRLKRELALYWGHSVNPAPLGLPLVAKFTQ